MLPARRADKSAVLVVPNAKGWTEAEHFICPSVPSRPVTGRSALFFFNLVASYFFFDVLVTVHRDKCL